MMQLDHFAPSTIGVVAIGRNEGERLKRCLESLRGTVKDIVYVDSGSTDDSVAFSLALGITVVELDLSLPFTAARARNAGFSKLLELQPAMDYVFFVDGDCEVIKGWLQIAGRYLDEHPDFAVVYGFRRERFPEKSVYNMLCDVEWLDYPTGETKYCGGDALIRVSAFRQVHGYRPDLICWEEPEMCVRLHQAGWRIWRSLDVMTLHDAAIYRFSQWWKRMQRAGYGSAQAVALHGSPPGRHGVLESRRAWTWGLLLPLLSLVMVFCFGPLGLLILLAYPLQIVRIALVGKHSARKNWWRAGALTLGKFPEVQGQLQFMLNRVRGGQARLIEYK
jgi:GT2 family glycosyltransferase